MAESFFEVVTVPTVIVVPTSRSSRSSFIMFLTCVSSFVPIARFKSVVAKVISKRVGGSWSGFPIMFPDRPSALVSEGSR